MASRNQDVHLRIFMDANTAEQTLDQMAIRLGKVADKVKEMKKQMKEKGVNRGASPKLLEDVGLGGGFMEELKELETEHKVLKNVLKQSKVAVKDLNQMVSESAKMSQKDLEYTARLIEGRYKDLNLNNQRDRRRAEELRQLYSQVARELDRRGVKQMDAKTAAEAYARAETLMAQGAKANVQELRIIGNELERAAKATDISLQESQKYAAAAKAVNARLNEQGAAFMTASQQAEKLARAQELVTKSKAGKGDSYNQRTEQAVAEQRLARVEQEATDMIAKRKEDLVKLEAKYIKSQEIVNEHLKKRNELEQAVNAARDKYRMSHTNENKAAYEQAEAAMRAFDNQRFRTPLTQGTYERTKAQYERDIQLAKEAVDYQKQVVEQAKLAVAEAEKAGGVSLQSMRRAYDELKSVMNHVVDPAKRNEMLTTLQQMDEQMKAMSRRDMKSIMDEMSTTKAPERLRQLGQELLTVRNNGSFTAAELQKIDKALIENEQLVKRLTTVQMDKATADKVMCDAETMLKDITTQETQSIREMIDALKLAENAQGQFAADSAKCAGMRKQLEDSLRGTAIATMENADIIKVEEAGMNAEVSQIKRAIESLKAMKEAKGTTAEQAAVLDKRIAALSARLGLGAKSMEKYAYDEQFVKSVTKDLANASINDLDKALKMLDNEIKTLDKRAGDNKKRFEELTKEYLKTKNALNAAQGGFKGVKQEIDKVNSTVQKSGDFFSKAATKLLSYIGIFGGFYLVRQKLTEAFNANIEYSDSLTNIRKTTQMTTEQIRLLAEEIKMVDTRSTVQELNDLAYAAGKLGIKGVDNVLGFVRAADQLKIALGEQLGDSSQAVEQIYKITNIMGTTQQYGLEESLTKLGSSINYLTMMSQASAQPMVDFMKRTAGIGTQAGMTAAELAGWAGAVAALGQPVEMSATSISKMMVQISSKSKVVAAALKMTNDEIEAFRYDVAAGRMSDAMLTVLRKVNEAGGLSHLGTIVKDLGSEGQRVVQTIATLASGYQTVEKMVRMSNEAFDEGTSVINEYNLKNQNAAAMWAKFKNEFNKMIVSPDNVEMVKDFIRSLRSLPDTLKQLQAAVGPIAKFIGNSLLTVVTQCTSALVGLAEAMLFRSAIKVIPNILVWGSNFESVAKTWHNCGTEIERAGHNLDTFHGKALRLKLFMQSASFGNWVTIIASIGFTLYNAWKTSEEAAKQWSRSSQEAIDQVKTQSEETAVKLNKLRESLEKVNGKEYARKQIIDELNTSYGEYIDNLLTEESSTRDIASAIESVNKQLKIKALLEAQEQKLNEVKNKYTDERVENRGDMVALLIKAIGGNGDKYAKQSVAGSIIDAINTDDGKYNLLWGNGEYGYSSYTKYKRQVSPKKGHNIEIVEDPLFNRAVEYLKQTLSPILSNVTISDRYKTKENGEDVIDWEKLYKDLAPALGKIIQTNDKMNDALADVNGLFNSEISKITNELNHIDENGKKITELEYNRNKTYDAFRAVEQTVTNGGTYVYGRYTADDEAVKIGERQAGDVKGFADKEQENYYVREKEKYRDNNTGRMAMEGNLARYVENANILLKLLRQEMKVTTDATQLNALTEEYNRLNVNKYNAQTELDIMKRGQIEDKEGKGQDAKDRRESNEMYNNIIAKIKTIYEMEELKLKEMLNDGLISQVAYNRAIEDNQMNMLNDLSQARLRIVGDIDDSEWKGVVDTLAVLADSLHSVDADQVMMSIRNTDVRSIGRKVKEDSSWISGVRLQGHKDKTDAEEIMRKRLEEIKKQLLDNNPIGKMTDEYFDKFQDLSLMLADLKNNTSAEELAQKKQSAMSNYMDIGRKAFSFDINTEDGLNAFKELVRGYEEFSDAINKMEGDNEEGLKTTLQGIYYLSYQYYEKYEESISKIFEKDKKTWEKMYKHTETYIKNLNAINVIEAGMKGMLLTRTVGKKEVLVDKQASAKNRYEKAKYDFYNGNGTYEAMHKANDELLRITYKLDEAREKYQDAIDALQEFEIEKAENEEIGIVDKELDTKIEKAEKLAKKLKTLIEGDGGGQDHILMPGISNLEKYGLSPRIKARENVKLANAKLNQQTDLWQYEIQKQQEIVDAKRAERDNTEEGSLERAGIEEELRAAEEQMERIKQQPEAVTEALNGVKSAIQELREMTFEWVDSMGDAFEKFMDGFIPFRSWYDDNGSLASNVFGTKEERQEAFGQFMDDIKKTVRNSIVEQIKERISAVVQEKMKQKQLKTLKMEGAAEEKTIDVAATITKVGLDAVETASDDVKTKKKEMNSTEGTSKVIADKSTETSGVVAANMAEAESSAFAQLGPIAGAVAAAAIGAIISGLLTMAMNALGSSKSSSSAPKTKLVSGMLTYDRGNVQAFARTYDRGGGNIKMQPVIGDDGKMYFAAPDDISGTGMVTRPTLTSIGGQPALVGERGPEMVIGRETTRALQMDNPAILRYLVEYDRNHSKGFAKTFDAGGGTTSGLLPDGNGDMMALMQRMAEALAASNETNEALRDQLSRGIKANAVINKWGVGGLIDEVASGIVESKRIGDNKNITRLFGR